MLCSLLHFRNPQALLPAAFGRHNSEAERRSVSGGRLSVGGRSAGRAFLKCDPKGSATIFLCHGAILSIPQNGGKTVPEH